MNKRLHLGPNELGLPFIKELGIIDSRHAGSLPWHHNDGYELTYAYSGEFDWEISSDSILQHLELRGGDLAVTPPFVEHRGYNSLIGPGKLLYIVFDLEDSQNYPGFSSHDLAQFKTLWHNNKQTTAGGSAVLKSSCLILEGLLKEFKKAEQDILKKQQIYLITLQVITASLECFIHPHKKQNSTPIQIACEFMEKNYMNQIKVEQIAASTKLKTTRFYDLFMQEKGIPPIDYFSRIRCRKACNMLRDSNKSITEIAFDCGYSSSQYFSTCMRKLTGYSPSEYREANKLSPTRSL